MRKRELRAGRECREEESRSSLGSIEMSGSKERKSGRVIWDSTKEIERREGRERESLVRMERLPCVLELGGIDMASHHGEGVDRVGCRQVAHPRPLELSFLRGRMKFEL